MSTIKDYVIVRSSGTSSDPAVANGCVIIRVMESARYIKTFSAEEGQADIWETDLECVQRRAALVGGVVKLANSLPTFYRQYRQAVEFDPENGNMTINDEVCKADVLTEIRKNRNIQIEKLDVPFMRAVETGDTSKQTAIGAKKQILRDLPVQATANLASNSALASSNTVTRQYKLLSYVPDELKDSFIEDVI